VIAGPVLGGSHAEEEHDNVVVSYSRRWRDDVGGRREKVPPTGAVHLDSWGRMVGQADKPKGFFRATRGVTFLEDNYHTINLWKKVKQKAATLLWIIWSLYKLNQATKLMVEILNSLDTLIITN
jgi:hypothetical protein